MFTYSGFADEISPELSTQIKEMKKHGIRFIEARGVNEKNIADYSLTEAKEIKKQLDAEGMALSALGSPIGKIQITDPFGPELDRFKNILDLANLFETRYIRMFSFFLEAAQASVHREEVLERWHQYISLAKDRNVILLHENEKGIYGDTAARCLDLIQTLNCPYLKATFDPANFVQCHEDTRKAYQLLADHVEYMHIKDAVWETGAVVPAGMGDGNVAFILKELKNRGWSGFLSLEPHLGDFKGFAALEQGAQEPKPLSGPETFSIACEALNNILKTIE